MVIDKIHVAIAKTQEVAYWISIGVFTFEHVYSKGQSQIHANFNCEYLANGDTGDTAGGQDGFALKELSSLYD